MVRIIKNAQGSNYPGICRDLGEFLVNDAVENASYLMFEYADALTSAGLIFPEDCVIENGSENLSKTSNLISEMIN